MNIGLEYILKYSKPSSKFCPVFKSTNKDRTQFVIGKVLERC